MLRCTLILTSGEELLGRLLKGPSKEVEYLNLKMAIENQPSTENLDKLWLETKNCCYKSY